MNVATLRESFGSCSQEEVFLGCRATLESENTDLARERLKLITSYEVAVSWLNYVLRCFLDSGKYRQAMRLLWGLDLFDPRPRCVGRMLDAIENNAKVIILGASAMGKSYSCIAWLLVDWIRDPYFTGVKVISATGGHALRTAFSHLQRFHKESIIPLPGICQHGFIGISRKDMHACMEVISIPQNQTGRQALQGFHPVRRPHAHPVFGSLSRIRIFLDEAEFIPDAVWRGVHNLLSSKRGKDTVKIICATNPWDVTSKLAANAEPPQGWNAIDIDKDTSWTSTSGFYTTRVDAAFSENVESGEEIFSGLQTPEGYAELSIKGTDNPDHLCYGRGMYPLGGAIDQLIPHRFLDKLFGRLVFRPGTTQYCAGVDVAMDGDDCVMFVGQYGQATSWIPANSNEYIQFPRDRYCIQLEQFFTLRKGDTLDMVKQILDKAQQFGIGHKWIAVDKVGLGRGVYDILSRRTGGAVLGFSGGSSATHVKALEEHKAYADELYTNQVTQAYFTLRDFMEFEYIKCDSAVPMEKLRIELTARKRKRAGRGSTNEVMYGLEEKQAFKDKWHFSPDRADALTMLVFLCVSRADEKAEMEPGKKKPVPAYVAGEETFLATQFIDWTSD